MPSADTSAEVPFLTWIPSKVIHAFGPILMAARARERFYRGALYLYPREDGVLCIATDGVGLLAYLARRARLSLPRLIHLPPEAIAACKPREPIQGYYPGWSEAKPVPAWMQPGDVLLFHHGMAVFTAMPHPEDFEGEDAMTLYSCSAAVENVYHEDQYRACQPDFDPRGVITSAPKPSSGDLFDPRRFAMFGAAVEAFGIERGMRITMDGPGGAATLLFDGCPDLFGLLMPIVPGDELLVPAFVRERPCDVDRPSEVAEGRP